MRKLSRLGLLTLAGAASLVLTASTPAEACAYGGCSACGEKGNAICDDATCGYRWVAVEL